MNILLVDDSTPILRGVEKMIRHIPGYAFDVRTAANAYQALEMLKDFTPHLIIADIMMPGMSGLEFLENIYQDNYTGKAALLTAYGEFSYAQQAIRIGVVDYLLKPVNEDKLVNLVSELASTLEKSASLSQKVAPTALGFPDYAHIDFSSVPPVLHFILEYVDRHYMEDVALSTLAEKYNISVAYICSLFSVHLNTTFLSYLDQIRLQYAAQLLSHTHLSLDAIAQQTGFKYANQLLRVFRKRIGVTPTQYRKQHAVQHP